LEFHQVFHEPLGYYLFKQFLFSTHSVDKAVFVNDIETFTKLKDEGARLKFAKLICERYLTENSNHVPGKSVFDRTNELDKMEHSHENVKAAQNNKIAKYGTEIKKIMGDINDSICHDDVFSPVLDLVLRDLKEDLYPKFEKSCYYKKFIQLKTLEEESVTIETFELGKVLGRGAFGLVNMCVKRDTGKAYAIKCINKKRVKQNESVSTIMSERNFLAKMVSKFVICLKYAVMDDDQLYLVLDLREGGDLKFHLNKSVFFDEERSRFHAAEILLGLEHIHSHGIIYRDMKLENILLDKKGHCSLSDLGLAVKSEKVKGYAGTPGYTAPEVVSQLPYDKRADFFSYGVMVYRFICGKKPFQVRGRSRKKHQRHKKNRVNRRGGQSELDQNVLQMTPEYPPKFFSPRCKDFLQQLLHKDPDQRLGKGDHGIDEIKSHPWFEEIDFGLLEARAIDPVFVPNLDEVNADCLRHIARTTQDDRYKTVKLTPEFNQKLSQFNFKSKKAIQEECVEVLQRGSQGANLESPSEKSTSDPENNKFCCDIM